MFEEQPGERVGVQHSFDKFGGKSLAFHTDLCGDREVYKVTPAPGYLFGQHSPFINIAQHSQLRTNMSSHYNNPACPRWSVVKEGLGNGVSDVDDLKIGCFFCLKPMVPRLSPDNPNQNADDVCSGIYMLPCGHMVGKTCYSEWIASNPRDHCPACNSNFRHPDRDCGHPLAPFPFDKVEDVGNVPSCVQHKDSIPRRCTRCVFDSDTREINRFLNGAVFAKHFPDDMSLRNIVTAPIITTWGFIGNLETPSDGLTNFSLHEVLSGHRQLLTDQLWAPVYASPLFEFRADIDQGELVMALIEQELKTPEGQAWHKQFKRSTDRYWRLIRTGPNSADWGVEESLLDLE